MRTFQYKNRTFQTQRDLVKHLLDLCYDDRRPNAFYLTRTFDVIDSLGNAIEVAFYFDRDEWLKSVKWSETKAATASAPPKMPYTLYETTFVDCCGQKFATNAEVAAHLKKNPRVKYTLKKDGCPDRPWVWYDDADGVIIYDGKKYAA